MLSKLLKYEFRSTAGTYAAIYVILLGLSLMSGITTRISLLEQVGIPLVGITLFAVVIAFGAAVAATTVVNVNRFYQGVFKGEGYLINTLPVSPWQIMLGKLVPAVVWTVATSIVMVCASVLLLLLSANITVHDVTGLMGTLWEEVVSEGILGETVLELAAVFLGLVEFILQIYFCIALGQLMQKHRAGMAVLFWILVGQAERWITSILSLGLTPNTNDLYSFDDGGLLFRLIHVTLIADHPAFMLLRPLLFILLFWIGTQWVLSKRLNLE